MQTAVRTHTCFITHCFSLCTYNFAVVLFVATLRLPNTVTRDQRISFVDELLDILELKTLADRIIGNDKYPGLSVTLHTHTVVVVCSMLNRIRMWCVYVAGREKAVDGGCGVGVEPAHLVLG